MSYYHNESFVERFGCLGIFVVVFLGIFIAVQCSPSDKERAAAFEKHRAEVAADPNAQFRFDNVVRVMMHQPCEYTFYTLDNN